MSSIDVSLWGIEKRDEVVKIMHKLQSFLFLECHRIDFGNKFQLE